MLTADGRDMEWNGRVCPFQNAIDKSCDEEEHRHIGDRHPEQRIPADCPYADGNEKKNDDR